MTRTLSNTCGAASPSPSASRMVASMSSMSAWSPGPSGSPTGAALASRTGRPSRAILRKVMPLDSFWGCLCKARAEAWPPPRLVLIVRLVSNEGRPCVVPFSFAGVTTIVEVQVRDNNVDQALRALKKKMQREGLYREMRMRRHYEKPSERRAREKAEAVRRYRKLLRKRAERDEI